MIVQEASTRSITRHTHNLMPSLLVTCKSCDSKVMVDDSRPDRTARCPFCSEWIAIPEKSAADTPPENPTEIISERPKPVFSSQMSVSAYLAEQGIKSFVDLRTPIEEMEMDKTQVVSSFRDRRTELDKHASDVLAHGHDKRYAVGGVIAKGGMGIVLNAEDLNIRRPVAMKVMRNQYVRDKTELLRFIEEAQVTGQLEHPNIVPVHELGMDAEKKVFYTMKFVQGATLRDILDGIRDGNEDMIARHPLNHLLNIYLKACDAIAFANSRGVVHRDLKPDNIMVCDFGEVLVMDWGLAKILDRTAPDEVLADAPRDGSYRDQTTRHGSQVRSARQDDDALKTSIGIIMGTPAYMAPEQGRGKNSAIDYRTDIYALGGILYHILALRPPVHGETIRDVVRKVIAGEIPPLQFWNPDGGHREQGYRSIQLQHCPGGRIPESLAAVAMKALSVEQNSRYQSVQELQADIEFWQSGYATRAEEAGLGRQLVLLMKRKKKEFVMIAGAMLILIGVVAGFMFQLHLSERRAVASRDQADLARIKAQRSSNESIHAREQEALARQLAQENEQRALAEKDNALAAKNAEEEQRMRAETALYESKRENYYNTISLAERRLEGRQFEQVERLLEAAPGSLRAWEWGFLARRRDMALARFEIHQGAVYDVAFSPDGSRLAIASEKGPVKLLDSKTGRVVKELVGHDAVVRCLAFFPSGKRLITGSDDTRLKIWDLESGSLERSFDGHGSAVWSVAVSPDGQWILSGEDQGTARLWNVETGEEKFVLTGHEGVVRALAFAAGPRNLLTAAGRTVRVFDAESGTELRRFSNHEETVHALSCTPDGRFALSGSGDRTARLWDVRTGNEWIRLTGHERGVADVALTPDGRFAVTISDDRSVRIWNLASGELSKTLDGHRDTITTLAVSPDGRFLATGSIDASVRLWDRMRTGATYAVGSHGNFVSSVAFSTDAKVVATGGGDRTARLWDAYSGQLLQTIRAGDEVVNALAFSPDGRFLATGGVTTARLWDLQSGEEVRSFGDHNITVQALAFSRDSKRLASCSWDRIIRVWDIENGQQSLRLEGHEDFPQALAFSPSEDLIASGSGDHTIRLWDANTGECLDVLREHQAAVSSLAFTDDGKRLISGSHDQKAIIWDVQSRQARISLKGHTRAVRDVAFFPGGRRAVSSDGETARIWDAASGREVCTLAGAGNAIAVSPDGFRLMITSNREKTARIWVADDWSLSLEEIDRQRHQSYLKIMSHLDSLETELDPEPEADE